jgi:hypothetical protein
VKRIAISLDEHAHAELARRAQAAAEPLARTAARFVRDGLLSSNGSGAPATPVAEAEHRQAGVRPAWLEPGPGVRERWQRETWASVCALHERYAVQLARLPPDWFTDRGLVERLAALCAWRSTLDSGASDDPRSELLFHDRLEILERQLGGSHGYERFEGGPPPEEWLHDHILPARGRARPRRV